MPVRPFGSTTASRIAPVAAVSLPVARCTSTTRFGLPRLRSPLPSGTFTSLGIKAFNRVCCLPVHLTNPPDFLSLPAARPNKSLGCGSSFQVRYVSAGLLFLKPLGTFFTMLPMGVYVNAFLYSKRHFSSAFILFIFNYLWRSPCACLVDKTSARSLDFAILDPEMRRLVIRPGAIGDLIVSLPAIACLAAESLEVWTSARTVPLVRFAGRVRAIASTGLDLLGVTEPPAGLIDALREFDSIVSWYGANRPEFRETVAALGLPFTFLAALPAEGAVLHATDFYLEQVRGIAACSSDGIPRIECAVERGDYAGIHPFSGSARKNWPLERFRALAEKLQRVMPVKWCAGEDDPPLAGAVRIDDLFELACWLAKARVYIGNDSGITHLAAAVGTPVLALFGPTDPEVWAPRGPHVRVGRWAPGSERRLESRRQP